jgi:hypothetical protein
MDSNDNCPAIFNMGQWDKDKDGIGNECDDDIDGDTFPNKVEETLGSKVWDPSSFPEGADSDGDKWPDQHDNCPELLNGGQWDRDKDGIGNECDDDIDGDSFSNKIELRIGTKVWDASSFPEGLDSDGDKWPDKYDNCPELANGGQWDKDQDGIGNECDSDIDGDGYSNEAELLAGTKIWDPRSYPRDGTALRINEVIADNEGVYVDEYGQTNDWVELINVSDDVINLSHYYIADDPDNKIILPNIQLASQQTIVLWADDEPELGEMHLPFKISSSGENLYIFNGVSQVDHVKTPDLDENIAYSRFPSGDGDWQQCRYTSPNQNNPSVCQSNTHKGIDDDISFSEFSQQDWLNLPSQGLVINELALFPARFIEFKNSSDEDIDLSAYHFSLSEYSPLHALPTFDESDRTAFPNMILASGQVITFELTEADVMAINQQAFNEGLATLFITGQQAPIESVPFMHWPREASLARQIEDPSRFQFCQQATPNLQNSCLPIAQREVGDRLRGIYTPSDYSVLAKGSGKSNIESVKFVIDLNKGKAVHLLSSEEWPLHYSFVREVIDGDESLDRCDPLESIEFRNGWSQFSSDNYFDPINRRYHLGTLSKHTNADLHNVEFTFGDGINAEQMKDVFFTISYLTENPYLWSLRPQDAVQVGKAREIEGMVPIVSPKAPFEGIQFQGLANGVAYGTLQYIETQDLDTTSLGYKTIVITNDVPNDIELVGGLITEAFQTPLAHVNILSKSRNTPNLALPKASEEPHINSLLGKLVKFEVNAAGYSFELADIAEATEFWQALNDNKTLLKPRLDDSVEGLVDLAEADISLLPAIGGKAAQMAELSNIGPMVSRCDEGNAFKAPENAFAVPMAYYLAHFEQSGAKARLAQLQINDDFITDLTVRKSGLEEMRDLITAHSVDGTFLSVLEAEVEARFGEQRVRFRSSSNAEDLQEFNGAGLYTSKSAEIGDKKRKIEDALRTVWASLWNLRAYEERSIVNLDHDSVAMGVLIHLAFTNERANGVAVGRNILDINRGDQFYINTQVGEASVTNPAPGVITEELIYQWPPRTPRFTYNSYSSLTGGEAILSDEEIRALSCAQDAVQKHFKLILDPEDTNSWFTMETEFKFVGELRELIIKQARPYNLGEIERIDDCRVF